MRETEKPKLVKFAKNVYSQFGEDGIIEKVFGIIGIESKFCIEFGAWDGFHLSNTANLWTNGWKALLIEGESKRVADLKKAVKDYECICECAFVEKEGENSLESIMKRRDVPMTVDLLSIDIDGNDYYILESLKELRPRLIICEYNPSIPAEKDVYPEYGGYFGASAAALTRVATDKGYELIAITDTNCFFIPKELAPKFAEYETRLEKIKCDDYLVHLVSSYAGEYVAMGKPAWGLVGPFKGKLHGEETFDPLGISLRRLKRRATVLRKRMFSSLGL